jgi:predicted transcriptional regulator
MIKSATAAAESLRRSRVALGLSQSKLARLSGVSRFKLGVHELGAGSLTADELRRICESLQAESDRLRNVLIPTPAGVALAEGRDA